MTSLNKPPSALRPLPQHPIPSLFTFGSQACLSPKAPRQQGTPVGTPRLPDMRNMTSIEPYTSYCIQLSWMRALPWPQRKECGV